MKILQYLYVFLATKLRVKHIAFSFLFIAVLIYFGAFTHVLEEDYYDNFDNYPLRGDIRMFVEQLKNNQKPTVNAINEYNYKFLSTSQDKCRLPNGETLRLVYIVKSATQHFDRREAIRQTWGYEKRFSDVPIRTIFLLGKNEDPHTDLQKRINEEQSHNRDLVQADFEDSYFNNTIKTMMGFKWAVQYCPNSKFYMFCDDDMYISTKNVLRFVRHPTRYPEYMINADLTHTQDSSDRLVAMKVQNDETQISTIKSVRKVDPFLDFELPHNVELLAGYVFFSAPHRHRSSKWHVSLAEYPYHMWPPYVTAGAYILSINTLKNLHYASFFTKHFRFDDIYVGILAKKMGIEPYHCSEFYFYKKEFKVYQYRYVIASHGYENPNELLSVWNEMKSAGCA